MPRIHGGNVTLSLNDDQADRIARAIEGDRKTPTIESADIGIWMSWRQDFEAVATLNNWEWRRAALELVHAAGGEVKGIITEMALSTSGPVPFVLDLIEEQLFPREEAPMFRELLTHAQQNPGEDIRRWHGRIWSLYMRAHPDTPRDKVDGCAELIEVFIRGLSCGDTKAMLRKHRPTRFASALFAARCAQEDVSAQRSEARSGLFEEMKRNAREQHTRCNARRS